MKGYDRGEALSFMMRKIDRTEHRALSELVDKILAQCIDADLRFMHETGVLDDEGNGGSAYYEEDDAFEYIVEAIAEQNNFTPDEAILAASLVNDFMDLQQEYMERKGLVQAD
ncbi:MAG: hypothetical protein IJ083_09270 [Clostridia bacterium]|nr:hypothetical protein [Clostridia bacterium]